MCSDDFLLWQFDIAVQGFGPLSDRLVRASLLYNGVVVSDIKWNAQLNRFPLQSQRAPYYDYMRIDFGANDVLLPLKRYNDVVTVRLTFNQKIGRCFWLLAYTTQLPETCITQRYEVQFFGPTSRTLFVVNDKHLLCGNPLAANWIPLMQGPPTQQQRTGDRRNPHPPPPPVQVSVTTQKQAVDPQALERLRQVLLARMAEKPSKLELEQPYSP